MRSSLILVLCVAFSSLAAGAPTRSAPFTVYGSAGEMEARKCKVLSVKLNDLARDLYHKVRTLRIHVLLIYLNIFSFSIVSGTFSGCRLK